MVMQRIRRGTQWNLIVGGWIGLCAMNTAWADRSQEIEKLLNDFEANPVKVMNSHLPKFDSRGRRVEGRDSAFSKRDQQSGQYVQKRHKVRERLFKVQDGRAPFNQNDLAEDLVDNGSRMLRTLEAMESKKLRQAQLAESPWSDDYWGLYKGALAARYADNRFPGSEDWSKNKDYVYAAGKGLWDLINGTNSSSVDQLSPAEKYDLLVGDKDSSFTKAQWGQGQEYFDSYKKVETWMGLCHGWAPAAYMLPRPTNAVTMTAADGRTKIKFYPADIKALGTALWANAQPSSRFIGGRCNDKSPEMDKTNGRVASDDCFDTNPGTWHQVIVNQIGVSKRSFVMDATYDYEVWNQPVHAYSYSYFNPITLKETANLREARVSIADHKKDKFGKYRASDAKYLVGVAMDVTYVVETQPTQLETDSPARDALRSVRYVYDLELDAMGQIVGGEWYNNTHPDFVWTPAPGARAESAADRLASGNWNGQGPMPATWSNAAKRASQYGEPLAKIVETLITLSRVSR